MMSLALALISVSTAAAHVPSDMARIPSGFYQPFFKEDPPRTLSLGKTWNARPPAPIHVAMFDLDVTPVRNEAFLAFLRTHPQWQRSRARRIFVDGGYLATWAGDVALGARNPASSPVTQVSWFAARAYCAAHGKRLPTTAEWERALDDGGDAHARAEQILAWYGAPTLEKRADLGPSPANRFGVVDLTGLVWEWTVDFNDAMVADEGRGGDGELFCGSGGARAVDAADSATFMRYAFRSSLNASYTTKNLGFRCAKDVTQ